MRLPYRDLYMSHVIHLFNVGKLTLLSADWFAKNGLSVICASGRVVEIVEEQYR